MNNTMEKYFAIKIAKIRNSIRNAMEIALMPYEISTTQFVVLLQLCEEDRMTQKELANITNYKQSALTLILDKLELKKLIRREAKKNDRRAYLIIITEKGRGLENKLIKVTEEFEKKMLERISDNQKKEFRNILDMISYNLTKEKKCE